MLKLCGSKWKVLGVGRNYGQQKYGVEKNLVKYCFFGKESVSLHVSHSVQGLAKP